ncbi:hypothetical protein NP233_g4601 [Leucocoprinus birnbaumii]|uniref:Glucose receptor Git3 N-terminal domain-containing protein n=1 Tax=Leucocoprinus birnbaumii TaxID=56174 RepID=A0AAD5YRQ4_9AGAR|nr:hypothetical protein NP233_g4601 [Leucocoprinus birnbaumii]
MKLGIIAVGTKSGQSFYFQQIEDLDPLCQAQGYLRQVGDNSVALFSLLIGFDTFFVLTYGWRANKYVNIGALAAVCLFIVLLAIVPGMGVSHKGPPYMGTTGYWCWITSSYLAYQISLEYLWMWIAALVQLILYGLIALVMRRCLIVDSESKYRLRLRTRDGTSSTIDSSRSDELGKERKENEMIANLMLFYPAIYIICVLPLSIARWKQFIQCAQSPAAIIVTNCIFELSGLLTVLLYTFTRPALVSGRNLDQTRSANGLEDESDHKVSEHDNKDPSSCVIVSEVLDPKAPGNGEGSSTSGRVRPVSSSAR